METRFRTYKFTYNTTTEQLILTTDQVARTPVESTTERRTPTGEGYKQIFGSGKYVWTFAFNLTVRAIQQFFDNAYEASRTYDVTLSEENDDGSFTDHTVIIDRPVYSPDTIGDAPTDRILTVRVSEA